MTVFFDLETGGLLPSHPNIQLAAIAVDDAMNPISEFEVKILVDESLCDPEALKVNHYDGARWALEAVPELEAYRRFCVWLEGHKRTTLISKKGFPYKIARLAGHNIASFDVPRLCAAMERAGVGFWPGCWWYPLDTYHLALWHFRDKPAPKAYTLQALAAHFEIPVDVAHEALSDVRTNIAVARRILCP